jgi:AcrR family transcriptional regulator
MYRVEGGWQMPPKARIQKEDILQAAFTLVRKEGLNSLHARGVANELGSSTQPIFGYYKTMDDLKSELYQFIESYHNQYFNQIIVDDNIYINVGMTYVNFALEEPHLFRALFMSDSFSNKKISDFVTDDSNEHIASNLPETVNLESIHSQKLYTNMWLYAHGIASMVVTNHLQISKDEIKSMVTEVFEALSNQYNGGNESETKKEK